MTSKKTIIHIIDNLGRGGAETMLVSLLEALNKKYNVILITLNDLTEFSPDEIICFARYNLGFRSLLDLPSASFQMRKIIRIHKPDLVRSELFWSTIVARIAVPKTIPLVYSIHSQYSLDAFANSRLTYLLEKFTYRKYHTILSVSKAALADYERFIKLTGKKFVINNFVDDKYFNVSYEFLSNSFVPLKLVSVGNLKAAKNYIFLLQVMKLIKNELPVTLDIIGDGDLKASLQKFIDDNDLPVKLLGNIKQVEKHLPAYNAFVMCSLHEGFGNAPVEAMACGLPLLLNDIEVMKEMSKGNALFYKSGNAQELANLIINFNNNNEVMKYFSENGKVLAREYYTKQVYVPQLLDLYDSLAKA